MTLSFRAGRGMTRSSLVLQLLTDLHGAQLRMPGWGVVAASEPGYKHDFNMPSQHSQPSSVLYFIGYSGLSWLSNY